mmetsp:Transcript_29771/g.44895  ORF Transcript_29771/g.44895 Transcript_29771/m.44895 type:complete len:104 (+) Transcript_29771:309-620(+)
MLPEQQPGIPNSNSERPRQNRPGLSGLSELELRKAQEQMRPRRDVLDLELRRSYKMAGTFLDFLDFQLRNFQKRQAETLGSALQRAKIERGRFAQLLMPEFSA